MAKKKIIIDTWDLMLIIVLLAAGFIVYMTPIWSIGNPSQLMIFIMNLSDTILGWLIGGLVLKKIIDASAKK